MRLLLRWYRDRLREQAAPLLPKWQKEVLGWQGRGQHQFDSTLSNWQLGSRAFGYQCANPPYGKDWKSDQTAVEAEALGHAGRFGAGLPRISDGQMLFLQHMLTRMKDLEEGGGRVAIVMNGSPHFTGDAGSGENEIRRWILENDWLDAIIALPGNGHPTRHVQARGVRRFGVHAQIDDLLLAEIIGNEKSRPGSLKAKKAPGGSCIKTTQQILRRSRPPGKGHVSNRTWMTA